MTGQRSEEEQAWIILSDLFLDTEVGAIAPQLTQRLADLPFDVDTLERMLRDDVCPVCLHNLYAVAGVWDGFAPDDLIGAVRARQAKCEMFPRLRRRWRARQIARHVPEWAWIRAELIRSET